MANSRDLSDADLTKLIKASDSEEENVSEYENHTSDEIKSDCSNKDFDIQQMHNIQNIQSKNHPIQWKLDTIPHYGKLISNIIKTTPSIIRYATERIADVKSAYETVFNSTIQNEIIKMTNIVGGKEWKNIESETFQVYIRLLLLFTNHMENQRKACRIKIQAETYFVRPSKPFAPYRELFVLVINPLVKKEGLWIN
ncbi:hypothetical protein NPIL_141121 [Nephila pilipes]|uniref:Uncharacterized protein n=1 Tax=Nephila pilipes TaxID=299642 RepID=A0A8X6T818_NEPPI|nr:hypothetical protein NPIL_141121 [Nephila pilipes]